MASTRRQSTTALIDQFRAEPWRFDALVALRLREQAEGQMPQLAGRLDRSFPASDVIRQTNRSSKTSELPSRLEIASFGLADILPDAYLELLSHKDAQSLRAFLSIFEHRLIATKLDHQELLYPGLGRTRIDQTPLGAALISLIGLGTQGLRETIGGRPQPRMAGDEHAFMATAGLLIRRPLSLDAIARFIGFHIQEPSNAMPFAGSLRPLPADCHTVIGIRGQNQGLGRTTILGRKAFDASAGVRLEIGPISQERARELMPKGADHDRLNRLIAFAAGPTLDVEPILIVQSETIHGTRPNDPNLGVLGRSSFLGKRQGAMPAIHLPKVA